MSELDKTKLFRYLLDDLGTEERFRIEELYFSDDSTFDSICAAEDELIRAYLDRELRRGLRQRFEKRLHQSPRFRQRVVLAQDLMEAARPVHSATPPPRFVNIFQRPIFAISVISLTICMLVGGVGLSIADFKIKKKQDRLEAILKGLSSVRPAASFVLTPGANQRNQRGTIKELLAPMGAGVRLQALLRPEDAYKSYEAYLEIAEGAQVWSQIMLVAQETGSGRVVTLELPPTILREGDYILHLRGATTEGRSVDVASYVFRVKTPE